MNKELVTEIINNWVNARAASADYQPESRCSFFEEEEKNFVAEFPLPGLEVSQISIKTAPNKLKIEAEPSEEQSKRGISGLNIDFSLPMSADIANTKAELSLGILTLTIPKKTDGGYKKVTIKTS